MNWKVPLADLDYGSEEEQAILNVIKSRWLTMGTVTQEFEARFANFLGVKHALAVTNATVALHLACLAFGIGPGDEVIVPSLSFVATANAVLYTGAKVRFADINGLDDLTISPDSIEAQITPRTKAILLMHYGGFACKMIEIQNIAQNNHLILIEDAAHAPGSDLGGKSLGTWGDAGCFSFFSNKNLSTGEGGMLVTNNQDIAERVHRMRSHGMTSLTWDRHQGHAYSYDVTELGYNYRIDEMRSALGLVQLQKLQQNNARREAIRQRYIEGLYDTSLEIPFVNHPGKSSQHLFPILLHPGCNRKAFIDSLRKSGVQTSIHYPPIHRFHYYRQQYPDVTLPLTEEAASREVTLPLFPGMTDEMIDWVIESARNASSS